MKIKIYADENVNKAIVNGLKRRGIGVQTTKEAGNLGLMDEKQLQYATSQKACLFTHDDDFLSIAEKWKKDGIEHYGIIYLSQKKMTVGETIKRLIFLVKVLSPEDMKNCIEFL